MSQRNAISTISEVGLCLGTGDIFHTGHKKMARNPVSNNCDSHPAKIFKFDPHKSKNVFR